MTAESRLLSEIPGVIHGFGCAATPVPSAIAEAWPKRGVWKQVHRTAIAEVKGAGQSCGEVDALFTRVRGVPVAVATADCVPILLARRDGTSVAAVHAGWRGTRARILRELWKRLAAEGERPADWVAAIGPAIGPCCYEVDEALAQDFEREFGARAVPNARRLDLPWVNASELESLGLGGVDLLRACTLCTRGPDARPAYFSYRRGKDAGRQYSAICLEHT